MNTETALQQANELVAPWAKETKKPEPNRLDIALTREDLLSAITALNQARWGYLVAITGLDLGAAAGELEVLYHFCLDAAVLTLRVRISRTQAEVPSICGLIPAATFFERELSEMFGITILDSNYPEHLFLPEDWPAETFPLRKDFQAAAANPSLPHSP